MKQLRSLLVIVMAFVTCVACTKPAEKWNKRAADAFAAKNVDEAIKCYKKAIEIDPTNTKSHVLLGLIYKEQGMLDEAIFEFKQTVAVDPNRKVFHSVLGSAYLAKGAFDEAIVEFKKAIEIDPDFADAYYNLGVAYKAQGENTLAEQNFFEAGFVAYGNANKKVALRAYRSLKEIGAGQRAQDLYVLLAPLIESAPKE